MSTLEELDLRLTDLAKRLRTVQSRAPRLVLNMANLKPQRDFTDALVVPRFVASGDLEIHGGIRNDGSRDSGPFWVMTTVIIDGGAPTPTFIRVQNLTAYTTQSQRLAVITAGDIPITGWSLRVSVYVDPPQPGMPAGEVVESDATDNYDEEFLAFPSSKVTPPRPEDFEERPEN